MGRNGAKPGWRGPVPFNWDDPRKNERSGPVPYGDGTSSCVVVGHVGVVFLGISSPPPEDQTNKQKRMTPTRRSRDLRHRRDIDKKDKWTLKRVSELLIKWRWSTIKRYNLKQTILMTHQKTEDWPRTGNFSTLKIFIISL